MFRLLAVVLVCALLPQAGRAQDTSSPPPPDAPVVAPPLVSAPDDVEPEEGEPGVATAASRRAEEDAPVSTGPRIILETLSGGAGTFAGGLVGALSGILLTDCAILEGDCTAAALMGLGGMALGAAVATYAAGSLMKGRGGFMSTLIGSILGTGAGLLLVSADNGDGLGTVGLLALPAIGSMAGYELSRNLEDPARVTVTGPSLALTPGFGTTPHGGFMGGLSGRF